MITQEGEIFTGKDIIEAFDKEIKEWNDTLTIGDISYDKKYKTIDFKIGNDREAYHIEINRIRNEKEAFDWICHMHGKSWVTSQMIHDFISVIKRVTTAGEYCHPKMWGENE